MTPAVIEDARPDTLRLWPTDEPDPGSTTGTATPSLEEAYASRWNALASGFAADCLLCGGTVHPRWSAGAGVVGGRCSSCGTEVE